MQSPKLHNVGGFKQWRSDRMIDSINNVDCVWGMETLGPKVVDLAFADPPFNIGYGYDVYKDDLDPEKYLAWSARWIGAAVNCLKPNGSFWIAIGDEYAAELKVLATREFGLTLKNWVVWYYTNGIYTLKKFSRSHVHLLYFVKNPKSYTFNADAVRVRSARMEIGDKRACEKARLPDDTWVLRPKEHEGLFDEGEDVWNVPRVCGNYKERQGWHPCQMPKQVLKRIILSTSNAGDIVLDPFAGSGTTLCVAKENGRRFVGFEISTDYSLKIAERLKLVDLNG